MHQFILNILNWRKPDESPRLRNALARCRKRIKRIGCIIDVGASNGSWSLLARRHFCEASCLLVEAQPAHEPSLARLRKKERHFDYLIAAAGDRDGESYFDAGDLFGGVASHQPLPGICIRVPMVRLDSLLRSRSLEGPFLLKLDTHGFEVPILEGARETLSRSALLVIETYNFQLTPDSLRFHEICSYLEARGFRCVDLSNPVFRRDGVLWQMDLFFMPVDCAEFKKNSYA